MFRPRQPPEYIISNADQAELVSLRKEKADRAAAECIEAEKRRKEDYAKREWVNEGKGTGVQSLVIDGGKLWRIKDRIYFMPHQTTMSYGGLSGLGAQCGSYTSYGQLLPI